MRLAEFDKAPTPLIIQWALAKDGSIAGFFIRPAPAAAPTEFLEYQTQTTLRLPFEGNWFVFWGGRSALVNHHVASPSQRFACDFIIMKDGKSFEGNGIVNEEFIAWGKPVLAPGDGIITTVVNDVEDNAPRKMNPAAPAGNHVIIDHGNGEYSLLAHFQKGSITVKTGDSVKAGTVLGRCGNSGNTSEPHLHYHLQNSPNFPEGRGLPAQFQHYSADGKDVERGEPHRGQTIHSR
jgi:hypothetical protein